MELARNHLNSTRPLIATWQRWSEMRLTAIEGFAIEDRPVESSQDLSAERIRISSDYFKVLQLVDEALLRGRSFTDGDEDGKPLVAIIDEGTARKYWPTGDPLGRRVRFRQTAVHQHLSPTGSTKPWTTIVGIVKDIKSDGLDIDGVPHIYVSTYQDNSKELSVVLRTSLPAAQLEPQIRHEIQKTLIPVCRSLMFHL